MAFVDIPKFDFGNGYYYQPGNGIWKKDKRNGASKLIFDEDELLAITIWCDFVKGVRKAGDTDYDF